MTERDEAGPRGRLLLVTGPGPGQRRPCRRGRQPARHAVLVDGGRSSGSSLLVPETGWTTRRPRSSCGPRLLRWSAALAVAETYQLEGFDAVVAEDALGDRLRTSSTSSSPSRCTSSSCATTPTLRRRAGVCGSTAAEPTDATADDVVGRLGDALVLTSDPGPLQA